MSRNGGRNFLKRNQSRVTEKELQGTIQNFEAYLDFVFRIYSYVNEDPEAYRILA